MSKKNVMDIDVPHYSYFQACYLSFFSSKLYIDVAKRWRKLSLGYLLLVFALVSLPLSARIIIELNNYFQHDLVLPFQSLPTFVIQNGEVSFDKPMPYLVKNPDGNVIAIIDTTGQVKEINNDYPELVVLITKNKFHYRSPPFPRFFVSFDKEVEQKNYSEAFHKDMNQVFNSNDWIKSSHLSYMKFLLDGLIYPIFIAMFFAVYLVILLTGAMMVQVFSNILFRIVLSYPQAFRLLMVSATPHLLALAIYLTINKAMYGVKLSLLIIWIIYLSYSLIALKRSSNKLVHR